MNDLQLLFLFLVAFYGWECAHWIRRPGVVLRSWWGKTFRFVLPSGTLSNRIGGLLFSFPLPGVGAFFAVQWPPAMMTTELVISHHDPLDLADGVPAAASSHRAFDAIREIRTKGHRVWINGEPFAATGSDSAASTLAKFLKELKSAGKDARAKMFEEWWRARFDRKAVADRIAAWRRSVEWLGAFCMAEFVIVATACGWLIRGLSLRDVWPWFVGGLLASNLVAAIAFHRAHRRLLPNDDDGRVRHTTMMFLFPLATICAPVVLSLSLLEDFHPLAVAAELMDEKPFLETAGRQLRRARLWSGRAPREAQPYYQQLDRVLVQFLRAGKVDAEKLLAPPAAADPACRSFCPRCGSQFTFETGSCGDCGSIPVERIQAPDQSPKDAAAAGNSRTISSNR